MYIAYRVYPDVVYVYVVTVDAYGKIDSTHIGHESHIDINTFIYECLLHSLADFIEDMKINRKESHERHSRMYRYWGVKR